eukprot:scaffold14534_cov105-Cylindrotheca_fusiformis.AAC.1
MPNATDHILIRNSDECRRWTHVLNTFLFQTTTYRIFIGSDERLFALLSVVLKCPSFLIPLDKKVVPHFSTIVMMQSTRRCYKGRPRNPYLQYFIVLLGTLMFGGLDLPTSEAFSSSSRTSDGLGEYDPSEDIRPEREVVVGDPQLRLKEKERSVTSILKELAAIQQQGPQKYCILGTRHCSYLHQQIIELLYVTLV